MSRSDVGSEVRCEPNVDLILETDSSNQNYRFLARAKIHVSYREIRTMHAKNAIERSKLKKVENLFQEQFLQGLNLPPPSPDSTSMIFLVLSLS